MNSDAGDCESVTLVVRRRIKASPERLFRAWTDAKEFVRWWGPSGVVCERADIDLRVGGAYSIANRLDNGQLITISGAFELIEPPQRIVYSWQVDPGAEAASRVVVLFMAKEGDETEVVVTHERIATDEIAADHQRGWVGCLSGLATFTARSSGLEQ